jgi:hypothetical protein
MLYQALVLRYGQDKLQAAPRLQNPTGLGKERLQG